MSQAMTTETGHQESGEFTPAQMAAVEDIIARHKPKAGALIPVLEDVQEILEYLPKSIQHRIALGLGLPLSEVGGVVSFYSYFTTVPRGRHTVRCCLGTACYVRGGQRNLQTLTELLQVASGGTTADQRFSLETIRCLGACGLAPVMMVDEDTIPRAKPQKVASILENYK